jgi:dsRNA-specific ribonuclease
MEIDRAKRYVEQAPMEIWTKAFTHPSINPGSNYEELETRGDAILFSVFVMYLMERFKNISNRQITSTKNVYMSKQKQPDLSRKLGFQSVIRSSENITDQILEDVFESFSGALFEVSKTVDNVGRAYINCYNFIVWLFTNIKIELIDIDPKTYVNQTFTRFRLAPANHPVNISITADEENGTIRAVISTSGYAVKFFRERGIFIPQILGEGVGTSKKRALSLAYEVAQQTMKDSGLTRDWSDTEHQKWEFSHANLLDFIEKAKNNLRTLGYDSMYFVIPSSNRGEVVTVQLIGVTERNQHVPISSIRSSDELQAKTELLRQLAERI